jgi:hypothetical protein
VILNLDHDTFPPEFDSRALERGWERFGEIAGPMDGIDLVVTPDFEDAVRERLPDDARPFEYAQDRGALGSAMARVMPRTDGGIDVLIDSRILSSKRPLGAPEETFEHEAYHVLLRRRGECLDFSDRDEWTGGVEDAFLHAAEVACEEFRVELPICQRRPSSHYGEFPDLLAALDEEIRTLSWDYQLTAEEPGAVAVISKGIGELFGSLVTACGYVAATMEGQGLSLPEIDAPFRRRLLGIEGLSVLEELRELPGAEESADPAEVETLVRAVAGHLGPWLREIGFAWRFFDGTLHFDVLAPDRWLARPR